MAFGPIMQFDVPQKDEAPDLQIELAPINRGDLGAFIDGGMQQHSMTRYMLRRFAPVMEDEYEWFERVRTDKESLVWGIWLLSQDKRRLVGSTSLARFEYGPTGIKQAVSGVQILDKALWGKGITSAAHKARTWYAFTEVGLTRIKSAVMQPNIGSRRALEKSGYSVVQVSRNTSFVDGKLIHQWDLECVNPHNPFWSTWWGDDQPPKASRAARKLTLEALVWAKQNVTMP